jgi:hypothetical protein
MKIHFERTGGFAGMVTSFTVDTNSLPSAEADQVLDIVQHANFFNLPPIQPPAKLGAADYFTYKITVETEEGRQHTVECTDITMQPSIKSLIDFLGKRLKR